MAHVPRFAFHATLAISLLASVSCGNNGPDRPTTTERVTQIGQSIAGGVNDDVDKSVVAIVMVSSGGMCSGTLIAPNLVLTAHHCVAAPTSEQINCKTTKFGEPYSFSSFYVTLAADVFAGGFSGLKQAAEVFVPPGSDLVCGYDVALLRLKDNVAPTETLPLNPRVDLEVTDGEIYKAVGYGNTNDTSGAGRRRMREGLAVSCAPGNCGGFYIDQVNEWEGETGICQGDSGGPALDSKGRVIGVVSRGGAGCSSPIYGSVYAWADWIKEVALQAAKAGGYEPAPWVKGLPSDPDAGVEAGVDAGVDSGTLTGPGSPGMPCKVAEDCQTGVCVFENEQTYYCSQGCSDDTGCPANWYCDKGKGACFQRGGFAQACKAPSDCRNGMCVVDSAGSYCTQACGGQNPACPQPAQCSTENGWCFLPSSAPAAETKSGSTGGCSLGRASSDTSGAPWYLALALLALRMRRRSSVHPVAEPRA
ncbi:MAG: S1 family peptidase [Deltaproteobacteria bacterium]|nr:S1 family peptidase [Deltaproteobacteria bacterium]